MTVACRVRAVRPTRLLPRHEHVCDRQQPILALLTRRLVRYARTEAWSWF